MENQLEIYQSIIEDAVDSIFIGDTKGNLIFVNKAAEELTGYTKNELLSSNISLLFPHEQLKMQPLRYDDLNAGLVVTTERDILTKSGDLLPVEMKSKKLNNGNLQSFMRDNTERQKRELELKLSEEKYKTLFESSASGILIIDSKGIIINANKATHDFLGYDSDELIGKPVKILSHPDSLKDVDLNIKRILDGYTLKHTVKSVKKDGTTIFNYLYETKITISGIGDCIISISNDITKQVLTERRLKESEEKLRNIVEHSSNIFYSHGTDHKLTYLSPQIKKLLDYEVEEAMVKWTDLATDNPINQIGFEKTVKAINTGIPQAPYELELIGKNRKKVMVEVHEAPVVKNGKTTSIVGALVDITERKKAEIELVETKELFQFAIEGSDVGLWDWQVQTGQAHFNEKWANIIGFTLSELQPVSIDTWIHFCHPDDLVIARAELNKHFNGETKQYHCEFRMKNKSGDWVWILDRGRVVEWNSEKQPIRMVGTHLDISKQKYADEILKESEERYKSLFEHAAVPVWLEDFSEIKILFDQLRKSGITNFDEYFTEHPEKVSEFSGLVKIVDINEKSLEMFNVNSKDSLIKDLRVYFDDDSLSVFKSELLALAEGKDNFESEIKVKSPSGKYYDLIVRLSVPPGYLDSLSRVYASFLDITERKKTEDVIRESEAKIESIMKSAPVGIGVISNRVLEYVNDQLLLNLGYSREEMIGRSSSEFYQTLKDFENIGQLYDQLKVKESAAAEAKVRKKNGEILDMIIGLSPIDKTDFSKGVIFSTLDITENKKYQEKIIYEQSRYQNLFENSPVPLWEEDFSEIYHKLNSLKENGIRNLDEYFKSNKEFIHELSASIKIINVNKAALVLHKAENKEILFAGLSNIFTENSFEVLQKEMIAIFNGEKYFSEELEVKTLTGEKRIIDLKLYLGFDVNHTNYEYKALLATIDITDRILAENEIKKQLERNEIILNTMNDGFVLIDDKGNIIDANPAYCNMIEYSVEELLKMNVKDVELTQSEEEINRLLTKILTNGYDKFETKHKSKTGKILDLDISITIIVTENKNYMAAFLRDITKQKQALRELNQSRKEVSELVHYQQEVREEERQRIASEIHDDLGQALTALKLDTSILMNKISGEDEYVKNKLNSMKSLADQTIKTIQKILSDLRPGILNDLGLTAALEWEIDNFEERTGIKCTLKIIPDDISFDEKVNITVFRLVQEACTNVARHSNASELEIMIKLEVKKLHLIIKDNGIGITVEQANNSKSFGLFGMRERVKSLGGGINFVGVKNKGTTVNIVLPINSESAK
jgi:PAS domain S-box-containing protein